jgi:glycosyltransferase involved in cell wall biosynthesis
MTNPAPVSVVVPAYNAERFLAAALESVAVQTLPAAEVIVVDDGSTDRTAEIARGFGARVISQANGGLSAARNAGIRAAAQPWIALLDADDVWAATKIEEQWRALCLFPAAAMICCDYYRVDERGEPGRLPQIDPGPRGRYFRERGAGVGPSVTLFERVRGDMIEVFFPLPSTVLVRREAIISAGLFDERLRCVEDMECFLRVLAGGSLLVVERRLVSYRQHASNLSKEVWNMQAALGDVHEMIGAGADKYPAGAHEEVLKYCRRRAVELGRELIARGQYAQARAVLGDVLRKKLSRRAAALFVFAHGPRAVFDCSVKLKRLLVRKRIITELMEFRLFKNGGGRPPRRARADERAHATADQLPARTGD